MTQKKAPAATGAVRAAAWAAEPAAPTNGNTIIAQTLRICNPQPAHLAALAEQAAIRAEVAGLLAECCQAAGDRAAFDLWRRRRLAHQAILWAATHPEAEARP